MVSTYFYSKRHLLCFQTHQHQVQAEQSVQIMLLNALAFTELGSELQGCFDCTDWDVLKGVSESVNEATDVISSYINFCEDMQIPTKMVKIFPNNKPWITKALKKTLNEKKIAFQSKQDRKVVQKRLNKQIRDAKRAYKEKVETQFQSGSIADAWKGLTQLGKQKVS